MVTEIPDYDFPKSLKASQAMEDYDFPTPQGTRRSLPPQHNVREGRDNREKSLSAIPTQLKRISDSSSDSRPVSQSSGSAYSADTSSGSLDSSLTSGKMAVSKEEAEQPDYDIPRPSVPPSTSQQPEHSLDDELRKIDGLMMEVQQQRLRSTSSVSSANRITLDGYEVQGLGKHLAPGLESTRSSSSNHESMSSRSGSNDNLGVWDDVSFEEEEGDSEESDFDSGEGKLWWLE